MRVHSIVTAAGSSRRMGGVDKLTLELDGKPLLAKTLEPFLNPSLEGTVVVTVNPERVLEFQELLAKHLGPDRVKVCAGGEHRQQSILFGLRALSNEATPQDRVMIHDGARPFVTQELFTRLLEALDDCDGVIPALPVRDTVKRVRAQDVLKTEDRETLRLVQTPQAFEFANILELHEKAALEGFIGTDDASLLEHYGQKVRWVEGPGYNLKVTVPEDLLILKHLAGQVQA